MVKVPDLGPNEAVEGRAFTNPEQIPNDMNTLRYMIDQVYLFLRTPRLYQELERPITVYRPDRAKWLYRLVIPDPDRLKGPGQIHFVGFLGNRREDADLKMGDAYDDQLVAEIPEYPGLLCYYTMALMCGNFSNLVIFAEESVKKEWAKSKSHAQAVSMLSPDYYNSVRLYNGLLPDGVAGSQSMYLTRVKYFDYHESPVWHAVRHFDNPAETAVS